MSVSAIVPSPPAVLARRDPGALELEIRAVRQRIARSLDELDRRRRGVVNAAVTLRRCVTAVAVLGLAWLLWPPRPRVLLLRARGR